MAPGPGVTPARWLALGVAVSLGALPLLPQLSSAWPPLARLAEGLEPWFALHCHREAARSLSVAGAPLAVCARCTGLYWGFGFGALTRYPRLTPAAMRAWVSLAAVAMVLDVLLEHYGVHDASAGLRLASGLLLAYPVGVGLGAMIARAPSATQSP